MAESYKDGFGNTDLQLDPYDKKPTISDNIQQTIARLLGWHAASLTYKTILADTDGRLLVSSSPTQSALATSSQANVLLVSVQLLAANPNRKQYILENLGANPIFLGFGSNAIAASGFSLPSGGIFADDVWVGAITAIALVGSNDVRIVEM